MRFLFATTQHPLNVAKALKRLLEAQGRQLKLGNCRETVAKMFGYDSWHELNKVTDGTVGESLYADQMDADQVARWQMLFVERLSSTLAIEPSLAASIVEELKPLQRTKNVGEPAYNRKIAEVAAYNGFLIYSKDDRLQKAYRAILEEGPPRSKNAIWTTLTFEDRTFNVVGFKTPNKDLSQNFMASLVEFRVFIGEADVVLGVIDGYVVTPKHDLSENDFFSFCDEVDDRLSNLCYLLQNGGGLKHGSCCRGVSTLFLPVWETSRSLAPKGLGKEFLKAVYSQLARKKKEINVRVYSLDPAQYNDIEINTKLTMPEYAAAKDKLHEYISMNIDDPGLAIFVEEEMRSFSDPFQESIFRAGKAYFETDEADGGDMYFENLEKHGIPGPLRSMFESLDLHHLMSATMMSGGEPIGLAKHLWPEGFHWDRAAALLSFSPHPSLWTQMPSDIRQIDLEYVDQGDVVAGVPRGVGSVLPTINYHFTNGSILKLDTRHIIPGDWALLVPTPVRDARGEYLLKNPFTDRYSTSGLLDTLRINSLLLFDGNAQVKEPNWPGSTVSVKRPLRKA